ncbi:unnamed protein product [Gulo gulo]|uniref:Uncharacterized protein n=1 Tax=Gulo gulo TaxID=48420 RepID=A0A9X9LBL6_GULGU|nr:unnamed protein product [Gulo gulo]
MQSGKIFHEGTLIFLYNTLPNYVTRPSRRKLFAGCGEQPVCFEKCRSIRIQSRALKKLSFHVSKTASDLMYKMSRSKGQ